MVNLLVEDTVSVFPYQLLKPVFKNNIIGANGNKEVLSAIEASGDNTIVLLDVIPDNIKTIDIYGSAVDLARTLRNVYVIPYPCIEYCFIRAILGYVNIDTSIVLSFGNYKSHTHNIIKKTSNTKNYEKFCKSVVHLYKQCMRNNVFVTSDCRCGRPVDSSCTNMSVRLKELKLCCGLPIYPLETDSLEITKRKAQQAIHYGEEVFYKMSDCFIKHGIINYITVLPPNKIQ